ncbi:hypothetical protein FQR65_LT04054, partial [Abscondita terminalis]
INNWLTLLSQKYTEVTLVNGGKSYENRTILGVKISFKPNNKIIFIESGIHPREWIGPATVTYILNEILTNQDPEIRNIVTRWNWYFFPFLIPTDIITLLLVKCLQDRLWRKTRKPYGNCYGADLNRNWGYHWMDGGSSNISCDELFAGPN